MMSIPFLATNVIATTQTVSLRFTQYSLLIEAALTDDLRYFFISVAQLTTTVNGAPPDSSTSVLSRNRCPSALTA
jgi:hypothetical protein